MISNWSIKTDIGVIRDENQDLAAVFKNKDMVFAILCDGMGGHFGGSFASKATIETYQKLFKKYKKGQDPLSWFTKAVRVANKEMTAIAKRDEKLLDMGTTLTAILIFDNKGFIFNIGDSRVYYYDDSLHQLTIDQNVRNYYIHEHNISEEQAANIHAGNALTSALGPKKRTSIDLFEIDIDEKAQFIILTSDGIHDYISKSLFSDIISFKSFSLEQKLDHLIKSAIKGNSGDNLTGIILEVKND